MRICSKCGLEKPQKRCRPCYNKKQRDRYSTDKAKKANAAAYARLTAEQKRQRLDKAIENRRKKLAAYRTRRRKWYRKNREKEIARQNELKARRRLAQYRSLKIFGASQDILDFYENCPTGMTVDHIIPLIHPDVSGLHVLWNLQYLSSSENSKKGNSFTLE